MQVDLSLFNAKVYNIDQFEIVKGEKFSLTTDLEEKKTWFSNNDAVLSIADNGLSADIEAKEIGSAIILVTEPDFSVIKRIDIKVVAEIIEPAKTIGASADQPVLKD